MSQGPAKRTHVRREVNALSSRWTQMAQQNRSAGTPEGRQDGPCSTCPPDEHAVWQSQMSLKVVAGGVPSDTPSDMSLVALLQF